ncbi:PD-(D/E)XK nuclease family protein [Enterobacter sp. CC120223-11]|uniref:PD-(D/E)XK nuclease family protein n=1 Tax=Enterobacter sp. CC120223-11 TaxID=1378073 RepID=UPI000BE3D2DA|nr:PD-(D/E)XK nuclease family protein [Enterobacter sp. CC120223-11]
MDLSELKALLAQLKSLPQPNKTELNLFSIGAQGHYENPISDLLAFFIDPDAGHNLSTLMLEAFMECLPGTHGVALSSQPSCEVMTITGSRIDILLESEEWVMALENKIWHH